MKLAPLVPSPWRATLTVATLVFGLSIHPAGVRAGDDGVDDRQHLQINYVSARPRAAGKLTTNETGVRLLEAELQPMKATLAKAKCEQLVAAVGTTTVAHPDQAKAILWAALARRVIVLKKKEELVTALPCTCARRILLASIAAAPKQSSEFLDLAAELYPDCVSEFADAVREFDSAGGLTGGFGVGFGTGFPGSPGFNGSSPSGALALPPVVVTAVLNG